DPYRAFTDGDGYWVAAYVYGVDDVSGYGIDLRHGARFLIGHPQRAEAGHDGPGSGSNPNLAGDSVGLEIDCAHRVGSDPRQGMASAAAQGKWDGDGHEQDGQPERQAPARAHAVRKEAAP